MEKQDKKENQVVRPETPKGEDPARLNNLNPDKTSEEIARDTDPKQTPEKKKQEQGKVRSPRAGQDPGIQKKNRNPQKDLPTNPPHTENDGELWATDEQGKTNNAKA